MKKTCKGIIILICICIIFLISCCIIKVNAESSVIKSNEFEKSNNIINIDKNYFNVDHIKNGNDLIYTYKVGEMVFTSEKSEDDVWHKAMSWQYEQGFKTLEEIELEYGLYTSREIVNIPNMEMKSKKYSENPSPNDGIKVHLEWQPSPTVANNEAKYLPLKSGVLELYVLIVEFSYEDNLYHFDFMSSDTAHISYTFNNDNSIHHGK